MKFEVLLNVLMLYPYFSTCFHFLMSFKSPITYKMYAYVKTKNVGMGRNKTLGSTARPFRLSLLIKEPYSHGFGQKNQPVQLGIQFNC